MKKLLLCGALIILGLVAIVDIKEYKADYNKCVRILINEDEIANGCDKYFMHDKWYNDFMEQMFDEYNKIK